jgi:pimeloyl-ACP methyl ester carboxylesterase
VNRKAVARFAFCFLLSAICINFLISCAHSSNNHNYSRRPDYIYPEKFFTYRDAKVCYIEGGNPEGKPVIFLHGVLGDSHTWRLTMKVMEKDYHVYAIDLPGYGKSEKGAHLPMSISYYAELIHDFIEMKHLDHPVLVGASLSGHIVLYYALNFPETISKAAVAGSVGVDPKMRWYEEIQYAHLWNDFVIKRVLTPKRFKEIWTQQFVCSREYDDEYELMPIFQDPKEYQLFITSFNHSVSGIFFMSLKDQVKDIQIPLLILWGGQDHHHSVRDAFFLQEQVPNSKLAVSPECGHLLMLDDPEFFNNALINFIATGDPQVPEIALEEIEEIKKNGA